MSTPVAGPLAVIPAAIAPATDALVYWDDTGGTWRSVIVAGQLKGTGTNDNAAAGNVGEFVTSNIAAASGPLLSTGANANVTSISLTAGDWDVRGNTYFTISAGATQLYGAISTTSVGLPADGSNWAVLIPGGTMFSSGMTVPTVRLSLAATTTIYLVVQAAFASGTVRASGNLSARRMR